MWKEFKQTHPAATRCRRRQNSASQIFLAKIFPERFWLVFFTYLVSDIRTRFSIVKNPHKISSANFPGGSPGKSPSYVSFVIFLRVFLRDAPHAPTPSLHVRMQSFYCIINFKTYQSFCSVLRLRKRKLLSRNALARIT